jgi:hypothetical protein
MKFLTIGTFKDTYYTIPRAEQQKLHASQIEYNLELKKKMGDKFHMYGVPGWDHMIVFVFEFGNFEELSQVFMAAPVVTAGFFSYKSYPLLEMDEKTFEALLEAAKQ